MNMHFHRHLMECILDYEPVYSFWCFTFERMNGILGSYHTNNHNISVQLTCHFLDSKIYAVFNWPTDFAAEYSPILEKFSITKGSLKTENNSDVAPLPPFIEKGFTPDDLHSISDVLNAELPSDNYDVMILNYEAKALMIGNTLFGSHSSKYFHSSFILAKGMMPSAHDTHLASINSFIHCTGVKKGDTEKAT